VRELLAGELGELEDEPRVHGVARHEGRRVGRRLELAVEVVEDDGVEVGEGDVDPAGIGGGDQRKHGPRVREQGVARNDRRVLPGGKSGERLVFGGVTAIGRARRA
jgi:hypothetical protein